MSIKSRPRYSELELDIKSKRHIVVCDKNGAAAAQRMLRTSNVAAANTTVLVIGPGADKEEAGAFESMGCDVVMASPTIEAAMFRLDQVFAKATMGTRIYVAGIEGLIGQTVALAQRYGVKPMSVRQQHCGSLKRRVQCVHCKGVTEDVTTQIVTCAHCGVPLFVRDHFSRRLGAFMGVSADAEEAGVLPPIEEVFR
ncbi:MAG: hypothetical protein IPL91_00855 [Hyphomicrobium sp.]|nr:hypothetical protein [Hyphomicrobium sp.]